MKINKLILSFNVTLIVGLLIFSLSQGVSAQGQDVYVVIDRVITTDFPTVEVFVSIYDQNGVPYAGISKEDLQLVEDGTTFTDFAVTQENRVDTPLAIALLIDTSGSMILGEPRAIDNAIESARGFIKKLAPQDSVAVIPFNHRVTKGSGLTTDKTLALEIVDNLKPGGDTSLYEALYQGVEVLKGSGKKNLIILITDGMDSGTSTHTLEEAIVAAETYHIPIYPIGFGSVKKSELEEVVTRTGGFLQINPDSNQLTENFNAVLTLLKNKVHFTYTSLLPADQISHPLTVNFEYLGAIYRNQTNFIPKPLQITFTSPQRDEVVSIETTISTEVTSSDPVATVTFYSNDEQLATLTESDAQENLYTAEWDLTAAAPGVYELRIEAMDVVGNKNQMSLPVTVRDPVLVEITNPSDGAELKLAPFIDITVDSVRKIESGKILIDGVEWTVFTDSQFSDQWRIVDVEEGYHTITVEVRDELGHKATDAVTVYVIQNPFGLGPQGEEGAVVSGETAATPPTEVQVIPGDSDSLPPAEPGDEAVLFDDIAEDNRFFIYGGVGLAAILLLFVVLGLLRKKKPAAASMGEGLSPVTLALNEVVGLNSGKEWSLQQAEIRFGRNASQNDIPLQGQNASRRMAVIRKVNNGYFLFPMNPTNPVFVNNQPMNQQVLLTPGDELRMGESVFIVVEK